ncbi:MAG TPA: hypothetical protein DHN33_03785 [Eubacteriaceae bacterium]|nr:hypothetical protein [Eubacteriaceae bacterium]
MEGIKKTEAFLRKHKMDPQVLDLERESGAFLRQLEAGVRGEVSSLKMIPSYIDPFDSDSIKDRTGKVVAVDAGGTNLRTAIFSMKNKRLTVVRQERGKMPGTEEPISKSLFFEKMVEKMNGFLEESDDVGFCFSYPVEIQPDREGVILSLTKELQVQGIEGTKLAQTLNKVFEEHGKKKKRITVLNDTVATLLSAFADEGSEQEPFDSYVGMIVGTGQNTCYREKGLKGIVNVESGGYSGFTRGDIDRSFAQKTKDPNGQIFEKAISGAYLGGLTYELLLAAERESLFSITGKAGIEALQGLTAKEVVDFYQHGEKGADRLADFCRKEDIVRQAAPLVEALIHRSVKLLWINLYAILKRLSLPKGASLALPVEGSLFYASEKYLEIFDEYQRDIEGRTGVKVQRMKIEQASLKGSAVAAFLYQKKEG